MSDKRQAVYWDAMESERLTHTTLDDAVAEYVDELDEPPEPGDTLLVRGLAPMTAEYDPISVLDDLLEHLDDEYGDPDGGPTGANSAMQAAAAEFVRVVLAGYRVYMCEQVETRTVNLHEWTKARKAAV